MGFVARLVRWFIGTPDDSKWDAPSVREDAGSMHRIDFAIAANVLPPHKAEQVWAHYWRVRWRDGIEEAERQARNLAGSFGKENGRIG